MAEHKSIYDVKSNFNSEKSRFKLSKQRKFEIAIFFIDTFKLKAALLHILSLDRQRG